MPGNSSPHELTATWTLSRALAICGGVVIVCMLIAGVASAESRHTEHTLKLDDSGVQPTATIDRVAWLAGSWEGEGFGGTFEEVWSPPSARTMLGTFKLMHDGRLSMYEIIIIVEEKGSLTLRLKHFNADFSGWEAKDDYISFPLVALTDDAAHFEGLTYSRGGPDRLDVYLATTSDGEWRETKLVLRRAPRHARPGPASETR